MTDLLPCPFCGAKPRAWGAQIIIDGDCPESIGCANEECHMQPDTGYMPFDAAIAEWNTRAAPTLAAALALPEIAALVEAAKALAEQSAHVRYGATISTMNIHGAAKNLGPLVDAFDAALATIEVKK